MHLLSALVAGIRGCENGTVQLFRRDTVIRATWYEDFEGHGADSSGADIDLDSQGGAVVFVNELVRVIAKNSAGATIRDWVDGVSASCVEVVSDSFTGVDYDTAATGASEPTNLGSVLNLWNNSAGAIDWKIGSGASDLDDALVGASSLLFNVKAYGAVGDGVANDRNAITSAIAAAVAAGGGEVFFPGGTYRIASAITVSAKVNLRGASPAASVILVDYASDANGAVRATNSSADTAGGNVLTQLTIRPAQSFTGPLVRLNRSSVLYQCVIGDETAAVASTIGVAYANTCDVFECRINVVGTTGVGIGLVSGGASGLKVRVDGCFISARTASYTGNLIQVENGANVAVNSCTFTTTALPAAGAAAIALVGNTNTLAATGNRLQATSSAMDFIDLGSDTRPEVAEAGNSISAVTGGELVLIGTADLDAAGSSLSFTSRARAHHQQITGASIIPATRFSHIHLYVTDNSAYTITFEDAPPGLPLTVIWHNDHAGGGGTITFDTTRVDMSAASNQFTVAANSYRVFNFVSANFGGTLRWSEVGAATADEPE